VLAASKKQQMHFNFIGIDKFDLSILDSVGSFVDNCPDFQTVWLKDENELNLLLELLDIHDPVGYEVNNTEFPKYWDLSNFKFPELDSHHFDIFFENWIQKTNRAHNMDEYGQLIFLLRLTSAWQKLG
jgi:Zn-finger nucleic acid-binding protein